MNWPFLHCSFDIEHSQRILHEQGTIYLRIPLMDVYPFLASLSGSMGETRVWTSSITDRYYLTSLPRLFPQNGLLAIGLPAQ